MIKSPKTIDGPFNEDIRAYLIAFIQALCLIAIIITNLILWIILRLFRTPTDIFVIFLGNMVIVHYIAGVVSTFLALVYNGYGWLWPFSGDFCEFWHLFDSLSRTASAFCMLILILERFLYITNKVGHARLTQYYTPFLWCFWSVILVISLYGYFYKAVNNHYENHPDENDFKRCNIYTDSNSYTLYLSITSYWLPTIISLILYAITLKRAHSQATIAIDPQLQFKRERTNSVLSDTSLEIARLSSRNSSWGNTNKTPSPRQLKSSFNWTTPSPRLKHKRRGSRCSHDAHVVDLEGQGHQEEREVKVGEESGRVTRVTWKQDSPMDIVSMRLTMYI